MWIALLNKYIIMDDMIIIQIVVPTDAVDDLCLVSDGNILARVRNVLDIS